MDCIKFYYNLNYDHFNLCVHITLILTNQIPIFTQLIKCFMLFKHDLALLFNYEIFRKQVKILESFKEEKVREKPQINTEPKVVTTPQPSQKEVIKVIPEPSSEEGWTAIPEAIKKKKNKRKGKNKQSKKMYF